MQLCIGRPEADSRLQKDSSSSDDDSTVELAETTIEKPLFTTSAINKESVRKESSEQTSATRRMRHS
jgi:hypothetical protein